MKCFIPAWYSGNRWWVNHIAPTYIQASTAEFDDLISLMGIHAKNKHPFEIVLLNYSPDLRMFLHRHGLIESQYWSVFDHIQGFTHRMPCALDYRTFDWPEETEFMYATTYIRAITSPHHYTNLYYNQEGYLMWMIAFEDDVPEKRYVFDDRGFLSSMVTYDTDGEEVYQYYMTFDGDWVMKEDLKSKKVTIHPKYQHRFQHIIYTSMPDIIDEWLMHYFEDRADINESVLVASDYRHNAMISRHVQADKLCFSIFEERPYAIDSGSWETIESGHYWLVDTLEKAHELEAYRQAHGLDNQLMRITPFDVQMTQNMSSQLHEIKIGLWVDGMTRETFDEIMGQLEQEMLNNAHLRLVLMNRDKRLCPDWVKPVMGHYNPLFAGKHNKPFAFITDEEKQATDFITLETLLFEYQLIELISTLRLVIDLNVEPNLFLQICAIGAAVPQINCRQTDYVQHGMNGYVIENIQTLYVGVDYFLNHLKNWNRSFAYSMKLAKHYASEQILKQLDAWLAGETHG